MRFLKAALAGIVAGAVASFVMEQFQQAFPRAVGAAQDALRSEEERAADEARRHWDEQYRSAASEATGETGAESGTSEGRGDDPTTVKVAATVSEGVLDRPLADEEKSVAGEAVHYSFGTLNAVAYSVLVEVFPRARAGFGLPFGVALWLGADELMLWALGLSKRPTAYPAKTHAYALSSHLVYGATAEAVRRLVRALL